ncbi:MAG: hypothetical protein HY548_03370 [Elusimicrobia bacterium]|nr:hypothetical protein [Elusimicrobiota bacterium]
MKRLLPLAAVLLFSAAPGLAADLNENEMFSSPDVVTQAPAAPSFAEGTKSLAFSGELLSAMEDTAVRTSTAGALHSFIVGNAFIDARLKNGVKGFANLEATYDSRASSTTHALREIFFDFNIKRRVYFRTGKQVLQWGRCALWNPTDLVNVERKPFIRKIGYREGAYGLKLHVPFGTAYNVYGFLDTGNAPASEDLGGALKFELLAGGTEMAFSGWAKKSADPVLGYDLSTRAGDIDIVGELSVSKGGNIRKLSLNQGVLAGGENKGWAPRAAVNLSKGFRLGNYNDRLNVSSEFFYNRAGYKNDVFNDPAAYPFATPLVFRDATGALITQAAGTKKDFLLGNSLYNMNSFSRAYGALFVTVGRFLTSDMTLNMNYVRNFNDGTGIVSTGITYRNLSDFTAGFLANVFVGPKNGEYTFSNVKHNLQLTAGIAF